MLTRENVFAVKACAGLQINAHTGQLVAVERINQQTCQLRTGTRELVRANRIEVVAHLPQGGIVYLAGGRRGMKLYRDHRELSDRPGIRRVFVTADGAVWYIASDSHTDWVCVDDVTLHEGIMAAALNAKHHGGHSRYICQFGERGGTWDVLTVLDGKTIRRRMGVESSAFSDDATKIAWIWARQSREDYYEVVMPDGDARPFQYAYRLRMDGAASVVAFAKQVGELHFGQVGEEECGPFGDRLADVYLDHAGKYWAFAGVNETKTGSRLITTNGRYEMGGVVEADSVQVAGAGTARMAMCTVEGEDGQRRVFTERDGVIGGVALEDELPTVWAEGEAVGFIGVDGRGERVVMRGSQRVGAFEGPRHVCFAGNGKLVFWDVGKRATRLMVEGECVLEVAGGACVAPIVKVGGGLATGYCSANDVVRVVWRAGLGA